MTTDADPHPDLGTASREFLSRMSHELRTPLNSILGFGQLLQLEPLTAQQRSNVNQIVGAGRHLLALVDDVLDLARVESGQIQLSVEPVLIDEAVDDAVAMIRPLAAARDVTITTGSTTGEQHVLADRQRLKQVLLNLLSNAVKYNRDGGGVVVSLAVASDHPARLRLEVADNGIGIDEHDLSRLFAPFERLSDDSSLADGVGLGLTLSKQLVSAMGGELGVTSTAGVGSRFWIDLPCVDAVARADDRAPAETTVVTADGDGAPITVLYIEDNLSNIKLVERVVATRPSAHLLVAMHGRLGVELAREHVPSLILLDLHLPDMSGAEVLRRLRADERTASTPIVMLSADATAGQAARLLRAGATEYITKPFEVSGLLALIDRHAATEPHQPDRVVHTPPRVATLDPGVVDSLRELAGMSPDGVAQLDELLHVFLADTQARLDELDVAVRSRDSDRTRRLAHSLIGSTANLGASALAAACREIETGAISGELPADGAIAHLHQLFGEAAVALRTELHCSHEVAEG